MVATMTLAEFYRYIRENRKRIADVYREIEEVQYQFNSLYEQQAVERQSLIVTYAPLLQDAEDLSGEMTSLLSEQEQLARTAIEEEIAKLEPEIAVKRSSGDDLVQEAQRRVADLRKQNPILDRQEEALKARHATLQSEIASPSVGSPMPSSCAVCANSAWGYSGTPEPWGREYAPFARNGKRRKKYCKTNRPICATDGKPSA